MKKSFITGTSLYLNSNHSDIHVFYSCMFYLFYLLALVLLSQIYPHVKLAGLNLNLILLYANNKGAGQSAHPSSLIKTSIICSLESIVNLATCRERSGSVVDCLTPDRRATGPSLTCVTALLSLSKTHLS